MAKGREIPLARVAALQRFGKDLARMQNPNVSCVRKEEKLLASLRCRQHLVSLTSIGAGFFANLAVLRQKI